MVIQFPTTPQSPTIDAREARWAAEQLDVLIAQFGGDSVAGMILQQARRELASLVQSSSGEVLGPFRVRVAA